MKYAGYSKTVVLRILPKTKQKKAIKNGWLEWIATGPYWQRFVDEAGKVIWFTTYSKRTKTYQIR